jgi:hypothetical protein
MFLRHTLVVTFSMLQPNDSPLLMLLLLVEPK